MNKYGIYIMLIIVCGFYSCDRDEAIFLSGDIIGYIQAYDQNSYSLSDRSGVTVTLSEDTIISYMVSDQSGRFVFEDIIYGNYLINLEKEGFVKSYSDYRIHHLGGYSPTLLEYKIYEIPGFEIFVDSIVYEPGSTDLNLFGKISGNEGKSRLGLYYISCFFNDSPLVSKDHFISANVGFIRVSEEDRSLMSGKISIYGNLYDMHSDSVYMCAYPQAFGQSYHEFYYESLGKSSNVIGFLFN